MCLCTRVHTHMSFYEHVYECFFIYLLLGRRLAEGYGGSIGDGSSGGSSGGGGGGGSGSV